MSVEKFFALYFPLKTKAVCTVKTAKKVTIGTAIIIFAFDAQFFFIVKANNKVELCEFIRVSESYTMTLNRIDAVLYSFAPFTIIGSLTWPSFTNLSKPNYEVQALLNPPIRP